MEIVEEEAMKKKSKLLSVEDYLDFFDSRNTCDLTVDHLLQIIGMHGFKKRRTKKKILIDAVSIMEVMNLCRSTLSDNSVSGDIRITLKEVIDDLKQLDWKECHVSSVLTLSIEASVSSSADSVLHKNSKKQKSTKLIEIGAENSVTSPDSSFKEMQDKKTNKAKGAPLNLANR